MDSSDAVKVIQERISKLEPEHVAKKIIGYIYFHGLSDQEMIRLALGPDTLIHNLIQKAKTARILDPQPVISPPISPTINPSPSSDPSYQFTPFSPPFRSVPPYWNAVQNPQFKMMPYSESIPEEYSLQMGPFDQLETVKSGPSIFPNDYYHAEAAFDNLSIRGCRNTVKTCQYFNRGYCKHGNNCRYLHVENNPHMFGPNSYEDDQVFSPGTLERLEAEITEILKSRRGNPVSIASLPMMYYEKYGKTLQAEGYLTESQRHGKAGYSLTKLLARLKNNIRLIDRPHGQHSVILAEDAPKYMDIRGERNDPGPIVSGSRQIYLTFPAESTFTEEDVSNYFNTFGPVQDVRIPCQQKRMFGFVTFANADTVKIILSKGNPHFVCGARVLVKPYREKSKLVERKYLENFEYPMYYNSHPIDVDPELQANWESSRLYRRILMEEQKQQALEIETMRLSQLQLANKTVGSHSYMGYSMPQDHIKFPSAEGFNYLLDNNPKYPVNNCGDQESGQGHNSLPDSPFASVVASSISAVI